MNRTKKRSKRASPPANGVGAMLKHVVIGTGTALLVAALLSLLGAALCLLSDDPAALTLPVGLIALYLAAAMGGMITARLHKENALLCGLLCGGLITVFFWFLTIFFPHASPVLSFPLTLFFRFLTIGSSVLGSTIGLKKQHSRRHKKRK